MAIEISRSRLSPGKIMQLDLCCLKLQHQIQKIAASFELRSIQHIQSPISKLLDRLIVAIEQDVFVASKSPH